MPKRRSPKKPIYEKFFFIPDTHIPYHDEQAFQLLLRVLRVFRPNVVVILGDFVDFYKVSKYKKNPGRLSTKEELEIAREKLIEVTRQSRKARKIYLEGNHEFRLKDYVMHDAPGLLDMVTFEDCMGLEDLGWEFVRYKDPGYIMLDRLLVAHDLGSSGMNAHRQALKDAGSGVSVVIGHTHGLSYETQVTVTGKFVSTMMTGWLGDYSKIDYMHKVKTRQWTHGCGIGYRVPDGTIVTRPVPFVDGHAIVNGKVVTLD